MSACVCVGEWGGRCGCVGLGGVGCDVHRERERGRCWFIV